MPVTNAEVADVFREIADLLAIEGANRFRVRAYRDAAGTVARLSEPVADMVAAGDDLSALHGIGDDLADKIATLVANDGHLPQLDEIRARTPPGLADLLKISGLGPKRVRRLHEELGITNLTELGKAAQQEQIRTLSGFGPKLEQKIAASVADHAELEARTLLQVAEQMAEPLLAYLKTCDAAQQVAVAGSYRRRQETVGDLDFVAAGDPAPDIIAHFVDYEDVDEIDSQGDTRATVILRAGMQVDLRAVAPESFGAALLYLTGSRPHTLVLRNMAVDRDLKLNEYGIFRAGEDEPLAAATEEEIYAVFGLDYIPPELREDRGEFDAARDHTLPELITLDDMRGDLQCHTVASDGHAELRDMAEAARALGYGYLAITDHAKFVGITHGLDAEALAAQIDAIDALNDEWDDFRLLKACEVDIDEDGALVLPDDILARLDLRICSVHTHFDLARDQQTERIIRAMDNPHFNILAHPTGRIINKRAGYAVDLRRVMEAAKDRGCFLEINAAPDRLDLDDAHAKMAKEMGLKLAVSTDAHDPASLKTMRFGINQARRGWLSADDVLNTRSWSDLRTLLRR
ncbi:MAG: DNA polymerase/3'-5' exonuclease PolX [Caldilineaceae bacterium]|nr:DNA polymerase/3'-5' exonuclease PolX [Caldilineaceae bacterium]